MELLGRSLEARPGQKISATIAADTSMTSSPCFYSDHNHRHHCDQDSATSTITSFIISLRSIVIAIAIANRNSSNAKMPSLAQSYLWLVGICRMFAIGLLSPRQDRMQQCGKKLTPQSCAAWQKQP